MIIIHTRSKLSLYMYQGTIVHIVYIMHIYIYPLTNELHSEI